MKQKRTERSGANNRTTGRSAQQRSKVERKRKEESGEDKSKPS
jgi:hypothetical protein